MQWLGALAIPRKTLLNSGWVNEESSPRALPPSVRACVGKLQNKQRQEGLKRNHTLILQKQLQLADLNQFSLYIHETGQGIGVHQIDNRGSPSGGKIGS